MMYAFAGVGIALPHYSGSQYEVGVRVPVAHMRRGDVLFYGENGGQHVALYLGDNLMVEAPNAGSVVRGLPGATRRDDALRRALYRFLSRSTQLPFVQISCGARGRSVACEMKHAYRNVCNSVIVSTWRFSRVQRF